METSIVLEPSQTIENRGEKVLPDSVASEPELLMEMLRNGHSCMTMEEGNEESWDLEKTGATRRYYTSNSC